jgi:plastocyanin
MRTRIAGAATGLLAAAVLSACGGSGGGGGNAASTSTGASSSSSSAESAAAASSAGGSQAAGSTVQVEAKDYTLSLSSSSLSPGEYTFQMTNGGNDIHAIEIDGPGVEDQKSDTTGPGGTVSLTVTLQSGDYEIYCPESNHRAMGMQTTFTVG